MRQADPEKPSLFVVLPNINIWNADDPGDSHAFLRTASRRLKARADTQLKSSPVGMSVLDRIAPKDTMLVAMGQGERLALQRDYPGLRVVPVAQLAPLWLRHTDVSPVLGPSAGKKLTVHVTVVEAASGAPLAGVDVVGFTDRAQRVGSANRTNGKGVARLVFPSTVTTLETIEATPASSHWPTYARSVSLADGGVTLSCKAIDLSAPDVRSHFGFEGADADGKGVRVAVVDTGVARHRDLRLRRYRNVVKGESATDVSDQIGHGTHVAGIIAGRGQPRAGVRGVAPGVELHAYRVFGDGAQTASSFHIAKAIRQAVTDGCDLINLSLGGEAPVPEVEREIQRARARGVVCVAATGNDYRSAVNYPSRYSGVLAVSACGRKGTYPAGAAQALSVARPFGTDRKNFVADFSNVGCEVSLIGPGVGIVSTYPGGYAVMDGTSMACPAITGGAARLLARVPKVLNGERNQKRSDAIVKLVLEAAQSLGFGATFEGAGILV